MSHVTWEYGYKGEWFRLTEAARKHGCSPSTLIARANRRSIDRRVIGETRPMTCPCCRREMATGSSDVETTERRPR